jgi:molybdenum cofactor synthesis domain-containing protein
VLDLLKARGHVAAEDVKSPVDVPPFDRAQYDGFAVRATDTFGADESRPKILRVVEDIAAGQIPKKKIRPLECSRIATGAPIPSGADAVVMAEHASERNGKVAIRRAVTPGENVIKKGADAKRGETLVRKGSILGTVEIGALAAAGISEIRVFDKLRIGIISTGNELLAPGARPQAGKIYDVNGYVLHSTIEQLGATPRYYGAVPDDKAEIKNVTKKALRECDVVLLSGGTSAGSGDLVPETINSMGKPGVVVHGLAQKPGKPTFFAVVNEKLVVGLPGYPVSSLIVFNEIVAPLLGLKRKAKSVKALLGKKHLSVRGRREVVPVRLRMLNDTAVAFPVTKDSGAIVSLTRADGYFVVPEDVEIVDEGQQIEVRFFEG